MMSNLPWGHYGVTYTKYRLPFAILQGLSAPKKGKQLACIMSMTFVSGRQRTEPTQQTVQSVRNQVTFIILNSKLINSELEAHIAH